MKKHILSVTTIILFFALNGGSLKAQTVNPVVRSCQFSNPVAGNITDELKSGVEDLSQRTPYSTTWRVSNGKTIIKYSSQIINEVDANGNHYPHSVITGPTSHWAGGSTPSCLYPNFHTDSILVTVPAGMKISFFTVTYSYRTNSAIPIPKSDGVFYLSTSCGKTDTISCVNNQPGVCFLQPNMDLSNPLTSCIPINCNNAQSFWLDAHLARFHGGVGCDTSFVWYSSFLPDTQYVFSAYVEGSSPINIAKQLTAQIGPCNGAIKVTASGGTPPYTYLWSPNNQTTDSIGSLCMGNYCCNVTDSKGCTDSSCIYLPDLTGINTISDVSTIAIYPDPNNGNFTITGITQGQIIEVYDYSGQKLNTIPADNKTMQIDISDRTNGIYLVRILNKDGSIAKEKKIVKTQ